MQILRGCAYADVGKHRDALLGEAGEHTNLAASHSSKSATSVWLVTSLPHCTRIDCRIMVQAGEFGPRVSAPE